MQFGIRYLLRSGILQKMRNFAQPLIAISWRDDDLWQEMRFAGAEVYYLPEPAYGPAYLRVRKQVDIYHAQQIKSVSTGIDLRRQMMLWSRSKRIRETAKRWLVFMKSKTPGYVDTLFAREHDLSRSDSNYAYFIKFLGETRPDALFTLTPFHRREELLLRAAKSLGLRMITAIHSFDNLTTRGWIPLIFDAYFLWNRYNQQELLRIYPQAVNSAIYITGTPQFDFYHLPEFRWSEERWRQMFGIPPARPVLLFAAGPESIAPHEPHFLEQIDQAIENGQISGRPLVLFRRHPVDSMERWESVRRRTRHVVYDEAWDSKDPMYFNIKDRDLMDLASSLAYSAVHISTSSTMALDGAMFDKPQIAPAYDDRPGRIYDRICRELYQREHYLPITNSGGIFIAHSREELIAGINAGLADPARDWDKRKRMVEEICTFADGKCADRVLSALQSFTQETASAR